MADFADVSCVLKVNFRCEACKMQMMEVLRSIIGVYNIEMYAPQGIVKIYGEVDPDMVLSALARTGKHAELVWSKINHPRARRAHQTNLNSSLYNYNSVGNYPMVGPNYGNYPCLPPPPAYGCGNMLPPPPPRYSRHHPFDSMGRTIPNLGYYF